MKSISAYVHMDNNDIISTGVGFQEKNDGQLVSVSLKVICADGSMVFLLRNKLLFSSSSHSVWSSSFKHGFESAPIKAIVEIHGNGKLLYIQSFPLESPNNCSSDEELLFINPDVCWRKECSLSVSVFNTNGNVLFLKGIYFDLWTLLLVPNERASVNRILKEKGYHYDKIQSAIDSLINRGVILSENKINVEYI